ncbi:MAG: ribose 1,5-bisphosphate isomerase [bacterium (Candidatus Ratteibacteria) CG23_combo_of_CG06-09_8_20_14_all_48_7]|uniref:Thiamine thiazole synthase n=1 Tax=bacterium (Candidatus Ratteibacteria) CG23_combo_of_CG06-09_8_20_14_all_48_7 TaxID=2014292 RepID=A0A2G9YAL8_9BACT|nr:MAG: ribose 1,5-bisphosphate isomerase [bacterium (Candidatus Ratteibacteria) CG23_combo_of_CG06-09_8_20_14_all_48_7]
MLDDVVISRAIVETYFQDLLNYLENDVAIAGAGPAGLTAAYFLAKKGRKVAIFERQLRVGGGMPGGGMMFNKIVIQEETKKILDEFGIRYQKYQNGYYVADSLETTSLLTSKAIQAGAKIFNLIAVEDLSLQEGRVNGLVLNWSAVKTAGLHVDPITIRAKAVVDATGHDAVLCRLLVDKGKVTLRTPTGKVAGEGPMWAEKGEEMIIANTGEVFPGLFIAGMTVNAVCGGPRMGPIFGGMLLSGERLSLLIP